MVLLTRETGLFIAIAKMILGYVAMAPAPEEAARPEAPRPVAAQRAAPPPRTVPRDAEEAPVDRRKLESALRSGVDES